MWHRHTIGIDDVRNTVSSRGRCYANVFYDPHTNELFSDLQPGDDVSGYDFYSPKIFLCMQIEPDDKIYTREEIAWIGEWAVKKSTRHPWRSFFVSNFIVFVVLMMLALATQYGGLFIGLYAQYLLCSFIWLFVMKR